MLQDLFSELNKYQQEYEALRDKHEKASVALQEAQKDLMAINTRACQLEGVIEALGALIEAQKGKIIEVD